MLHWAKAKRSAVQHFYAMELALLGL